MVHNGRTNEFQEWCNKMTRFFEFNNYNKFTIREDYIHISLCGIISVEWSKTHNFYSFNFMDLEICTNTDEE